MRHFPRPLTREESDELVDKIEVRFDERGYGLWAVERRDDGIFLGQHPEGDSHQSDDQRPDLGEVQGPGHRFAARPVPAAVRRLLRLRVGGGADHRGGRRGASPAT